MKAIAKAFKLLLAGSFLMYLLGVFLFAESNPANWPKIGQTLYFISVAAFFVMAILEFVLLKKKRSD